MSGHTLNPKGTTPVLTIIMDASISGVHQHLLIFLGGHQDRSDESDETGRPKGETN